MLFSGPSGPLLSFLEGLQPLVYALGPRSRNNVVSGVSKPEMSPACHRCDRNIVGICAVILQELFSITKCTTKTTFPKTIRGDFLKSSCWQFCSAYFSRPISFHQRCAAPLAIAPFQSPLRAPGKVFRHP